MPVESTSDFNRIMRDALTLDVLTSLHEAGELEADELAQALMADIAEIRGLLTNLSRAGLLAERRDRFRRLYRLADELPAWVVIALGTARSTRLAASA